MGTNDALVPLSCVLPSLATPLNIMKQHYSVLLQYVVILILPAHFTCEFQTVFMQKFLHVLQ